jgi:hypothetical protein
MDDVAAGDLDDDGVPEFVVGYNGGGGVSLFGADGKERWNESDANVWHVEIVKGADGKAEIVHSNARGQMIFRDRSGKVLKRAAPDEYFSQFAKVQWPAGRDGFIHAVDDGVDVLDHQGIAQAHFVVRDLSRLSDVEGVAARLGGSDALVVTAVSRHWERSQVLVFDSAGLRYREVLSADCATVAAPEPGGFLLGCRGAVLRYALKGH